MHSPSGTVCEITKQPAFRVRFEKKKAADAPLRGPGLTTFAPGESENKSRIDRKGTCYATEPADRAPYPPTGVSSHILLRKAIR